MSNRAVFLDRDGVINEVFYHKEMGILDSPFTVDQLNMYPDVGKAVNKFHELGFKVIVVSNQPGIAKDQYTLDVFEEIRKKMKTGLAKDGASIDAEYYCLHHPDAKIKEYKVICECRKPKPGLLFKAAEEHDINLKDSWMIGDGIMDIQAGMKAGCKTILIGREKCYLCNRLEDKGAKPDFIAPNLFKASLIIEKEVR
jgi:D-glycero-D-manno-heptose 1,7-bisphosphate phosphatase